MKLTLREVQELAHPGKTGRVEYPRLRRFEIQCWGRSPVGINPRRPRASYKCRLPLEHHFTGTPHSTWSKAHQQERKWQRFHSWLAPTDPDPSLAKYQRALRSWRRYRREALLVGAMEESLAVQRRSRLSSSNESRLRSVGLASFGMQMTDPLASTVNGDSSSKSP